MKRSAIPSGIVARERWASLPRKTRKEIVKSTRRGQALSDPRLAAAAVGWAWEVLGPPEKRRQVRRLVIIADVLAALMSGVGNAAEGDVFDGAARRDFNPFVRRVARKIERLNFHDPDQEAAR